MIISHAHYFYRERLKNAGNNKYTGAYYYSQEIVKNIIPNVATDRNWVTVNIPKLAETDLDLSHSIVFIHNNLQPNTYQWLRKYDDLILICGIPSTMEKVQFFGTPIYLPLSVDVKSVEKYRHVTSTRDKCFAGRLNKLNNHVPKSCDILTGMPQSKLLTKMARYHTVYAVGRTAIQAKILGCEIGVYDERFPNPSFWKILDNKDAANILQDKLNDIERKLNGWN
jgi:hypothetical protein